MRTWAILPIKPFHLAKTRLAAALSSDMRAKLAETWYRHVLTETIATPEIEDVIVISRDARALAIARELDTYTVREIVPPDAPPNLNDAFTQATEIARGTVHPLDAVLLLPADLPFIRSSDLSAMIALADTENTIVLATDRKNDGTNAMLLRPPGLIPYTYGIGSFALHQAAAAAAGARVEVYRSERLMLDIDVPDDLALYYSQVGAVALWQTG